MDTKHIIGIMVAVAVIAALCAVPVADAAETTDGSTDEPATPTGEYSVSYEVNGVTYTKDKLTNPITLETLAGLGMTLADNKEFKGWKLIDGTDSTIYAAGSSYNITDGKVVKFEAEITTVEYTVTFTEPSGSVISTISDIDIDETKTITKDQIPGVKTEDAAGYVIPEGYIFKGWSLNGELVDLNEDGSITVTGDMTLVATYEKDVVVTFVVDGVTVYTHTMTGLIYPDDPVKDSFTFVAWALDGKNVLLAGANIDNLTALKLEEDAVLTAVFEPAIYTVTFTVDGVTAVTQTVKHGEMATEPAFIPAKEGYDFAGWDYDFSQAITGDTTIAAIFEEVPPAEPTGLADPVNQTIAIVFAVLIVGLVALAVWAQKKGKITFSNPVKRVKAEEKAEDKTEEEPKP